MARSLIGYRGHPLVNTNVLGWKDAGRLATELVDSDTGAQEGESSRCVKCSGAHPHTITTQAENIYRVYWRADRLTPAVASTGWRRERNKPRGRRPKTAKLAPPNLLHILGLTRPYSEVQQQPVFYTREIQTMPRLASLGGGGGGSQVRRAEGENLKGVDAAPTTCVKSLNDRYFLLLVYMSGMSWMRERRRGPKYLQWSVTR